MLQAHRHQVKPALQLQCQEPKSISVDVLPGSSWSTAKKAQWRQTALEVYATALLYTVLPISFKHSTCRLRFILVFENSLLQCSFQHGYDNYMRHAFPHDELKPISQDYTDSLGNNCIPGSTLKLLLLTPDISHILIRAAQSLASALCRRIWQPQPPSMPEGLSGGSPHSHRLLVNSSSHGQQDRV